MTCREFKHYAASLSLLELAKIEGPQLAGHTETCAACGSWLQKQRNLNAQLHALRARTASLEVGPDVERALLSVFRQGIPVASKAPPVKEVAVIGMKGPLETQCPHSKTAPRSTPFALRLSRVFEIGAYAAVAAAIVIAIFLGFHLPRQGSTKPVESKSAPQHTVPVAQPQANGVTGSQAEVASGDLVRTVPKRRETRSPHAMLASGKIPQHAVATGPNQGDAVADDSQSEDYADYVALMLCDPLSCASDTQVVRMELPGSATAASQGAQPQMADMIVGYDGVVRAIRFVN